MITSYKATPDIDVLSAAAEIPGFGSIAINAFVLGGTSRSWLTRVPLSTGTNS